MSFRSWLAQKIAPKSERVSSRSGTGFNDDDRDMSAQTRSMKAMLRQRQQALQLRMQMREIEDMEADLMDEGEELDESPEDYAFKKIIDVAAERMQAGTPGSSKTLTDDDIRAWISKQSITKVKAAKAMSDIELVTVVKASTGIDDEAAQRAVNILRAEF